MFTEFGLRYFLPGIRKSARGLLISNSLTTTTGATNGVLKSTRKSHRFMTSATSSSVLQQQVNDSTTRKLEDDKELISHLERTSLVGFGNEEAVARLEEAIKFAEVLQEVDTTNVEPMYTVLENVNLRLRPDKVGETNREEILMNASKVEEDYFIAPPGNVPLDSSELNRT